MKTTSLRHYYKNPRIGDVDAVAASLERFGQYRPIIANRGNLTGRKNEVLAGNHTLKAARKLGWADIDVEWVDVDDDTAARIVIADNRTSDIATYDNRELLAAVQLMPTLEGTGYSQDDMADLLAAAEHDATATEEKPDQKWEQASRRSIILEYPIDQFNWVIAKLYDLAKQNGHSSNAATAEAMLRKYTA